MWPQEDFEQTPLELKDKVVFIPYKGGSIRKGVVIGFTPKNVRLQREWLGKGTGKTYTEEYVRPPRDIVKI